MQKPYFDFAFIIPLREEFDRFTATFPIKSDQVAGTSFIAEIDLSPAPFNAVAILQDDMGKAAAARATHILLGMYDIGLLAVVGIAGGLSGDVSIGDICFTGSLFDILENAKAVDSGKGMKLEYNNIPFKTDGRISFALKYVSLGTDVKDSFEHWQLERHYAAKSLVPNEFIGRNSINEVIGLPQIHEGSIVCGAVSKSDVYKSNIKNLDRKLLAIETETGGVFAEAQRRDVPVVTIRGICDYADKNKNKFEADTHGRARQIAADNAVTFVKLQLANPQIALIMQGRRDTVNGLNEAQERQKAAAEIVSRGLSALGEEVHEQLTQLSPEYQGKPKGYRLPLPRVQLSPSSATITPSSSNADPISILETVARFKRALITLPKAYPDRGLPWIIAHELSFIEINGKQAVPVVIKGEAIKPPAGDFQKAANVDLKALNARADARPVFVIYDMSESSKSRIDHLKEQLELYPEAHLVLVNRNDGNSVEPTGLHLTGFAERYDLCEVSFAELTSFIKRSLQYEDQQASVLALRLQDMFRKFELNAHPTYFAGLSGEMLASLLKANRRAELLQLAVGGFLSFVVAGDKDEVILSRTTREKFLRKLTFAMEVEGKEYDKPSLVKFTEDFATEMDFDIDSIEFLKNFQDKGVIHYEGGKVRISLPFISSYLLASELQNRPADAERYFNINSDEFDYPTFDIYCELTKSTEIIKNIIEALELQIEAVKRHRNADPHILLTNEIRPAFVDNPSRFKAVEANLKKAFDDVTSNRSNNQEKQQLLDISERVEKTAREARESAERDTVSYQVDDLDRLGRLSGIATLALGSGSEQLDRDPKRKLAKLIVQASSALIDGALRAFPMAEFSAYKETIKDDAEIRKMLKLPDGPLDPKIREYVETLIDAYEFALLGIPMRAVFGQLGNLAGQQVLRSSVSSVSSDEVMEDLVARIWAAEINASNEKAALLAAIAALPLAPFLRHSLATYFVTRVFWNHWEKGNRLALLDAAEESLRPLSSGFDKGRLKRMVEREPETSEA